MNSNTWKIATVNAKGMNNAEKFDDIMNWIIHENFDVTILTETKLRPILAIFNSSKYKKNYISHWTIDPEHTKGSGVGIIIKRETIGNHIYKHQSIKRRCITIYCKFKGKKTISITGIYGPAAHNPETRTTIQTIINHIHTIPTGDKNTHHIFLGDFNEDPTEHSHTPILDELLSTDRMNLTEFLAPGAYTWSNYRDTRRTLDHIITSPELLPRSANIYTNTVHEHFETDHLAVITLLDLNHILLESSGAKRRRRRKDSHPILDKEKNKTPQWKEFHDKLEETFISPFAVNWHEDYPRAYNNIVNQLLQCAKNTLFWKNTDNGDTSKFTKTETLIHKGRRATTNLYRQSRLGPIYEDNKWIDKMNTLFPEVNWKPYPLPSETQRTLQHIKDAWQAKKRKLYILKESDTHKQILEAVKTRNDNFKDNKSKMLRSSLEKKYNRIDTSNIIDNGEYIDDPDEVKRTISQRARTWTRPRRFYNPDDFWGMEYEPKPYVPPDVFGEIMNTISMDELLTTIKEAPDNKAAGPSGLTYECWKHASDSVHKALLEVFE